jgi:p-aminobenzoyl-glutamate transporter AbgT
MVTAPSRHHDPGMTKVTNRKIEQKAPRRLRGFAWELLYLIVMAAIFNAAALGAVVVASGLAAPVQAAVGVSVLAVLVSAFSAVVRGLRFFG